jgi:TolB-like protein
MYRALWCMAVAGLLAVVRAEQPALNIAVTDLQAEGIEPSEARVITDRLCSELIATRAFTVLERGQMDEVLKEQGFQQSGCVSEDCMVEVGQVLGVSHIVAGRIGQIGRTITLGVRLVDVGTARIVQDISVDCRCSVEDVLRKTCAEVAREMARRVSGVAAPAPAAGRERSRGQIVRRIVLGTAAAALLGAGVWANSAMQGIVDENAGISTQYAAAPDNDAYADLSGAYQTNWNQAHTDMVVRNILYIGAGLCTVGFAISIPF